MIACACCAIMYIGTGVGFAVRTQGMAPAPSSHPHFHLWVQLGGLIADGAAFFRARVLQQQQRGDAGYEAVADASATLRGNDGEDEGERDDDDDDDLVE